MFKAQKMIDQKLLEPTPTQPLPEVVFVRSRLLFPYLSFLIIQYLPVRWSKVLKSDSVRLEPVFERATGLRTSNSEHAMHRHYSNSSLVVGQD